MKKQKLEILLTNDDGYLSKGFKEAVEICAGFGNVTAIGPKFPQSGKSASLTMGEALWMDKIEERAHSNGNAIRIFYFSGSPADCVKIAMNTEFSLKRKPDILVSGINHGSNASAAAIYSGTLGAAKEAAIYGIPALALSLDCHDENADFAVVRKFAPKIIENFLSAPPKNGIYINVNFPYIPIKEVKGYKFAEQGKGMWIKEFKKYPTPRGGNFYMMFGQFIDCDKKHVGDHTAVSEGYISIVPHNIDTTDRYEKERLANLWKL
ncbi:MAG: 5'/3'-nucleotidase SurE [Candidatus Egerieousia sp.]